MTQHTTYPPGSRPTPAGAVLTARELRRTFGSGATEVHALDGMDLEVPAGRLTVVRGPSGSGKTTLLNLLGGLDRPTSGQVLLDDGRVLSAPNLDWTEVPLVTRLLAHPELAGLSVRAQNDNRLSVLTEIDHRPGESFIYLRGSTGVGGAVVLDGALLAGSHGWAGEFGHTVIEPGGALCRCGRRGCLEAYVSYHALRERAGLGDDLRIEDLVDALALTRDRAEVIGMIGRSLGLAIANALNVLDMTTVVLSGYLAPIAHELEPVIRETVERHALAAEAGPVLIERSDGVADPALRGAARAALQGVFSAPSSWIDRARSTPAR